MSIEDEVLSRIRPTAEEKERIQGSLASLLARARETASAKRPDLKVMPVGSVAKDTYVKNPDLDVFILFPPSVERKELEKIGLEIGQEVLEGGESRYAEHPYIRGTWDGLKVDLVPCYDLDDLSLLRTAVDRTPFHTRFIKSHLGEGQHDDVRLLKQFMKGIGTYGAEAKVMGFSGYLVELLVLRYGSFREVLSSATEWKAGQVLTLQERGRHFHDPLVFYDPVDKERNVASALSLDNFALFIHAARSYLDGATVRFFFPLPPPSLPLDELKERMRERGTELAVVHLDRPAMIDDDLYPQVRRTLDGAVDLLERAGFKVYDKSFTVEEDISLVLELESATLPRAMRHDGPPAWIGNSRSFLGKWSGKGLSEPFLDRGKWAVMVERKHTSAADVLKAGMPRAALGSGLRGLRGLAAEDGATALNEENRKAVTTLLDKRKAWEI